MQVQLKFEPGDSLFVAANTPEGASDPDGEGVPKQFTITPKFILGWRYSPMGAITVTMPDGKVTRQLLVADKRTGTVKLMTDDEQTKDTEEPENHE